MSVIPTKPGDRLAASAWTDKKSETDSAAAGDFAALFGAAWMQQAAAGKATSENLQNVADNRMDRISDRSVNRSDAQTTQPAEQRLQVPPTNPSASTDTGLRKERAAQSGAAETNPSESARRTGESNAAAGNADGKRNEESSQSLSPTALAQRRLLRNGRPAAQSSASAAQTPDMAQTDAANRRNVSGKSTAGIDEASDTALAPAIDADAKVTPTAQDARTAQTAGADTALQPADASALASDVAGSTMTASGTSETPGGLSESMDALNSRSGRNTNPVDSWTEASARQAAVGSSALTANNTQVAAQSVFADALDNAGLSPNTQTAVNDTAATGLSTASDDATVNDTAVATVRPPKAADTQTAVDNTAATGLSTASDDATVNNTAVATVRPPKAADTQAQAGTPAISTAQSDLLGRIDSRASSLPGNPGIQAAGNPNNNAAAASLSGTNGIAATTLGNGSAIATAQAGQQGQIVQSTQSVQLPQATAATITANPGFNPIASATNVSTQSDSVKDGLRSTELGSPRPAGRSARSAPTDLSTTGTGAAGSNSSAGIASGNTMASAVTTPNNLNTGLTIVMPGMGGNAGNNADAGRSGDDAQLPRPASGLNANGASAAFGAVSMFQSVASGDEPPRLTMSTPITDPGFADELSDTVKLVSTRGLQSIEINIAPAELGPIRMKVDLSGNEADVRFEAANEQTRTLLADAVPALREQLSQSGIDLRHATVDRNAAWSGSGNLSGQSGGQGDQMAQQQSGFGRGQERSPGGNGQGGAQGNSGNTRADLGVGSGRNSNALLDTYA